MSGSLPKRRIGATGVEVTELGFGTAAIGNLYRAVSDDDASKAVREAIELGIRYFDTAPYYGFGLSERRLGNELRGHDDVAISTKVGRLLEPVTGAFDPAGLRHGFASPMPFEPVYDYSFDGILRSHAQSLQRLGLSRIDMLLVHDIGRVTHGDDHAQRLAQLDEGGGLKALQRLRAEGSVGAIGIGVNEVEICLDLMNKAELDVILLAGRYTLLEQPAIEALLPRCVSSNTSIVVGGPFNSGILATGASRSAVPRYNYSPAPEAVRQRVGRIEAICTAYGVPMPAVALQFPLAHPAVASVIPGFASAAEVRSGVDYFNTRIPDALWAELAAEGLIDPRAPIPVAQATAVSR